MTQAKSPGPTSYTIGGDKPMIKATKKKSKSFLERILSDRVLVYASDVYPGKLRVDVYPITECTYRINLHQNRMFGNELLDSWFVRAKKVESDGAWKLAVEVVEGPNPNCKFTKVLEKKFHTGTNLPQKTTEK